MSTNLAAVFLNDIESSLKHEDYSLSTRRLMDACEEFEIKAAFRTQVFELRQLFLSAENNSDNTEVYRLINEKASKLLAELRESGLSSSHSTSGNKSLVMEANGISKSYTKGKNPFTLHPLNVKLALGEITGLVGENGNGKTTLLRLLAGELSRSGGELSYPGLNVAENDWYSIKSKVAFIPQQLNKWHGTLEDNLVFYAGIHGLKGEENDKRVQYILYRLGLERFRDLTWNEISSGYKLRFELARALLRKPKLLLLDEPLANLDINAQQLFLQDLRFFTQSEAHPMSVVLSSQNLHEIEKVADTIIFIRQGKTIYNGLQKDFGAQRSHNSFEVSGKFSLNELILCFKDRPEFSIENAGTSFIINTGTDCSIYAVARMLEEKGLELGYIRDISQSTRKLFHKDM